jgi:hypothetical protein
LDYDTPLGQASSFGQIWLVMGHAYQRESALMWVHTHILLDTLVGLLEEGEEDEVYIVEAVSHGTGPEMVGEVGFCSQPNSGTLSWQFWNG